MLATLITPYKGYTRIEIIEQVVNGWRVKILGSGLEIVVYEDEFVRD